MRYVFPVSTFTRYRLPTHINDLVVDRSESETSEVFVVVIEPGQAPPFHQHDDTEQVFYILEGRGLLRIGPDKSEYPVQPGDVVRIPPRTVHSISCAGEKQLRYLAIDCFTAGRPAAEPTWDAHVEVMCRREGWPRIQGESSSAGDDH